MFVWMYVMIFGRSAGRRINVEWGGSEGCEFGLGWVGSLLEVGGVLGGRWEFQ